MDKRIKKTKAALHAAFFRLRAEKAIQDIKIAELCHAAGVNKTTFYARYKNIYDLSGEVERHFVHKVITCIPSDRDYTFENPACFTKEVTLAFHRHLDELTVLFSGSEFPRLSFYLEQMTKQVIFEKYPHLRSDGKMNVMLSYCIHGAFGAQMSNPDVPFETVLKTLEDILEALQPLMRDM